MKILSHDFTLKEKIIVAILCIALFGVFYFYVIKLPLDNAMFQANMQRDSVSMELNTVVTKLDRYQRMEQELENSNASYMPSYNASKKEVTFLDSIFKDSIEYGIKFTDVTREGNLIRRRFYFSFIVSSNKQAQNILNKLINSEYRCLVTDVSSYQGNKGVEITGNATFFETLVDGQVDAALPPDSSIQQEVPMEQDLEF